MNWLTRFRRWVRIRIPPVRDASTKPIAATVLPDPVACSNQKRRVGAGVLGRLLDHLLVVGGLGLLPVDRLLVGGQLLGLELELVLVVASSSESRFVPEALRAATGPAPFSSSALSAEFVVVGAAPPRRRWSARWRPSARARSRARRGFPTARRPGAGRASRRRRAWARRRRAGARARASARSRGATRSRATRCPRRSPRARRPPRGGGPFRGRAPRGSRPRAGSCSRANSLARSISALESVLTAFAAASFVSAMKPLSRAPR